MTEYRALDVLDNLILNINPCMCHTAPKWTKADKFLEMKGRGRIPRRRPQAQAEPSLCPPCPPPHHTHGAPLACPGHRLPHVARGREPVTAPRTTTVALELKLHVFW